MKKFSFTKNIEKLIDPIEVGMIHFLYPYNKMLPKKAQRHIVEASAKKTPYMGFVVEPYSYFIAYELMDIAQAEQLIPDNFKLIKTKFFDTDEPKYLGVFGCFNVHTSAFWGQRMEFYIIAEDQTTGLLTWIIIDYDSNTLSYDRKGGIISPDCEKAIITTNFDGHVIVDIVKKDHSRQMTFTSDIKTGTMTNLDQRLWIEGNLSIGYGRALSDNSSDVFALKFDPGEVEQAFQIPLESLDMSVNSWYPGLFSQEPVQLACFPYAQHFLSDSPGQFSKIMNRDELVQAVEEVNFDNINVYSTKSMRTILTLASIAPLIIIIILLALLMLK